MGRYEGQSGEPLADERKSQVMRQQTEDCHAEAMRKALTIAARSDNRRAIVSDSLPPPPPTSKLGPRCCRDTTTPSVGGSVALQHQIPDSSADLSRSLGVPEAISDMVALTDTLGALHSLSLRPTVAIALLQKLSATLRDRISLPEMP